MMPIPGFNQWAWLEADPVLCARVDKYVKSGKFPDRAAAIDHALRIYLKVK